MGSSASKSNNEQVHLKESSNENLDPRSPTPDIVRTPLQGKGGTKHNITKNVDLRKTFENTDEDEKPIQNNPILSAVIRSHLQSYDPRSPTQEFNRTPIAITDIVEECISKDDLIEDCTTNNINSFDNTDISNKKPVCDITPKNLCDGFFNITLDDTFKELEEPLGSSTASCEAIESTIKDSKDVKATTLLETNFDYVTLETEMDINKKYFNLFENKELTYVCNYEISNTDPRSPTEGIERTPIIIAPNDGGDICNLQRNVEEMSDDTLIKVLQNTNSDLRRSVAKSEDLNIDGLLIYEDESAACVSGTPKNSKSTKSRMPLSCMKNKESGRIRSKSANTLYYPKGNKAGPSKIPRRVSNIPRLKALSNPKLTPVGGSSISLKNLTKAGIGDDCENTPPQSSRDLWDKDSSIIL